MTNKVSPISTGMALNAMFVRRCFANARLVKDPETGDRSIRVTSDDGHGPHDFMLGKGRTEALAWVDAVNNLTKDGW